MSIRMRATDKLRQAKQWLEEVADIFGDESDRDVERPEPYLKAAINNLGVLLDIFADEYDQVDRDNDATQAPVELTD